MSFSLTSNFFSNARGFTFTDSASVTWAFNANTNAVTATAAGGGGGSGTVTSVGLADTSTTPIFVVSNTPVTISGTIDITLSTQTAKTFFAGPTSGGAAQPAFRVIAAADVPTLNQSTTGNAATASAVAWTGVTGTPTTLTGYGIASPLPIAQGGTGQTTAAAAFNALAPLTTTGDMVYDSGAATAARLAIGSTSQGLTVADGIPTWAAIVNSIVAGTGITVSGATGAVTVNCSITQSSGANPTAEVALAAVNGSAATFMRSDGAPPIDQTIAPTWTGLHTFSPSGATVGIIVNAAANQHGARFVGGLNTGAGAWAARVEGDSSATGFANGLWVFAGTNSSDAALLVQNSAGALTFLKVFGDGHGTLGASATAGIQWTSAGAITSSIGTTLTTAALIGAAAADTVGFYGKTPAAQTASNTAMLTASVASASVSVSTAYASAEINSIMTNVSRNAAILQEVMNVLFAIGIYATH